MATNTEAANNFYRFNQLGQAAAYYISNSGLCAFAIFGNPDAKKTILNFCRKLRDNGELDFLDVFICRLSEEITIAYKNKNTHRGRAGFVLPMFLSDHFGCTDAILGLDVKNHAYVVVIRDEGSNQVILSIGREESGTCVEGAIHHLLKIFIEENFKKDPPELRFNERRGGFSVA